MKKIIPLLELAIKAAVLFEKANFKLKKILIKRIENHLNEAVLEIEKIKQEEI